MNADEEATMATLSARRSLCRRAHRPASRGRIANTAGDSVLAYQIEPAGHETAAQWQHGPLIRRGHTVTGFTPRFRPRAASGATSSLNSLTAESTSVLTLIRFSDGRYQIPGRRAL